MFDFVFYNVLIGGELMVFDDFKECQNVSYSLLKNAILNDKLSHAYLIDTNNYDKAMDFVLAFVKMIVCENHYSNDSFSDCNNCSLCKRIDDGNYSEIRIIDSDTSVIKKEQLLELQNDFSMSSIEGKYRIYIIKDCDKMNKQASNSLLKFLEEPVDGIVAILMTNNVNRLLSTIVSRCQLIRLDNCFVFSKESSLDNLALVCCNGNKEFIDFKENTKNIDILNCVLDFIEFFEDNGLDILVYMKKMWYNMVQTREENILAFKMMIYFYYDVLKCKMNGSNFLFCEHINLLEKVADLNNVKKIVEKIDIIQYGYDMLIGNLNVNLLLDDIVIRLGEV